MNSESTVPCPQLSVSLISFAARDPGSWEFLLARARLLDAAGFDRLVVSDHVVFGENLQAYADPTLGGTAGGAQPTGPDGAWLEPLTTLAVIAGMTTRVRLATGILLAALRRPAVLAKTAATLDVLSGGRLDLGVGVGWQREEYEATGLDFARRGELLNHSLEVCQVLWREQRASYVSAALTFDGIHAMPKPRQPAGVPLWISGTVNARVAARLATFGSGWIPWGADAADLRTAIPRMRAAIEAAGGDPGRIGIVGNLRVVRDDRGQTDLDQTMAQVADLAAAGVTDFRTFLPPGEHSEDELEELRVFVAAFRASSGSDPGLDSGLSSTS